MCAGRLLVSSLAHGSKIALKNARAGRPDEVVAIVQNELQRLGYYSYAVDGNLAR